MNIRFHVGITAHERSDVAAWIDKHNSDDVDLVIIEEVAVVVYGSRDGPNRGTAGVAVRHGRRLTEELDEALAMLLGKD